MFRIFDILDCYGREAKAERGTYIVAEVEKILYFVNDIVDWLSSSNLENSLHRKAKLSESGHRSCYSIATTGYTCQQFLEC